MATPGEYLVNNTVTECASLVNCLISAHEVIVRVTQRMLALGTDTLDSYTWPAGYTKADFIALYTALSGQNGLVVDDTTRDEIYKLLSFIQ